MKKGLIKQIVLGSLGFLPVLTGFTQEKDYPENYFRDPLNIPLRLSGSFGELRGGHFHSGLDFKTKGQVGLPLYAAAKGHISRIKVSPGGFGKALYLRHPNGFTTVYAHIHRFNQHIARFVKKVQYDRKTYALNLYPNKNKFQVEKGELIGYSGNSGSSRGPHLHFEVRETKTEKPINPLFFGFNVKDSRYPIIRGVRLYPLSEKSEIKVRFNHHTQKQVISHGEAVTLDVANKGNQFYFKHVDEICAVGNIGVGVEVYDYHEGSHNPLGVYQITLKNRGELVFQSTIDKFSFANSRYVNAHIDYANKVKRNAKYQRCYILPGNALPFYETKNNGKIKVAADQIPNLKLSIKDTYGNESILDWEFNYLDEFQTISKGTGEGEVKHSHTTFPFNEVNKIEEQGIKLRFPKGAFYDTVHFTLKKQNNGPKESFSPVYEVHNRYTPVHKYYSMAIKASGVPVEYREKALIAFRDKEGTIEAEGGRFAKGYIKTKTRQLGPFHIRVDTVAPTINPVNFKKGTNFTGNKAMKIIIKDDLAGIEKYKPKINGEWVRMAYDEKNDLLVFKDFSRLKKGNHELLLTVYDKQGNKTTFKTQFKKL